MKSIAAAFGLLLLVGGAHTQDAKPSKAQTIEYIHANYPKSIEYVASVGLSEGERLISGGEIKDLAFTIVDTRVTASWSDVVEHRYLKQSGTERDKQTTQHEVIFDLKDIEAIEGATPSMLGDLLFADVETGSFPMYLLFKTANGKPTVAASANGEIRMVAAARIPFSLDARSENHRVLKEFKGWQLYKALEHLRKLSGAPDPVRF